MDHAEWTAVDRWFESQILPPDPALAGAAARSTEAGLPPIAVSPLQGAFLHVLARGIAARAILEIGTLGGYSAIALARALVPGGVLVTLEADPKHAAVARANLEAAGVADRVTIVEGAALETLPRLAAGGAGPFDLVFVDADKPSLPEYFEWAVRLARPGALLVFDNVVREGRVVHADGGDPAVEGVRRLAARLQDDPRVAATAIQTVGAKGWDGFALAVVLPGA